MVNREVPSPSPFERRITNIEQFSLQDIVLLDNGVDITVDPIYKDELNIASLYEENCFHQLAHESPALFFLGPHVIDYLAKIPDSRFANQPDTIAFRRNPQQTVWTLQELCEFKLSRVRRTTKKAAGFSALLDRLRGDPSYLPDILRQILPSDVSIAKEIAIPANSEIGLTFVTPFMQDTVGEPISGFQVFYKNIPRPQAR